MVKRALPMYCYRLGRKGYIYFRKDGTLHRMPDDPTSAEFASEYARLRSGKHVMPSKRTMKKLIEAYMRSDKWPKLAENTRKSYMRSFRYLEEKIGDYDPATLRPSHVYDMRDRAADKPTTANRRVGALSVLLKHAVALDWVTTNAAADIPNLEGKRAPRTPWPVNLIQRARDEADPLTLLIFEMLLGTGQRVSDVLAMQWGHIEDGGIWVTPGKTKRSTKKRLFIPFTGRVATLLAETPRLGLFIIAQPNGRPVSYNSAWQKVMDLRKRIGAEDYDIHSLRHSAASEIAAIPGMTAEHVQAITGHSSAEMVRLYAGAAAQRARAKEAQKGRK